MSTNAITYEGELVNIDGNGNRVACLIHGPRHVIIIAGMNKVATTLEGAFERARTMACPPNAVRLDKKHLRRHREMRGLPLSGLLLQSDCGHQTQRTYRQDQSFSGG